MMEEYLNILIDLLNFLNFVNTIPIGAVVLVCVCSLFAPLGPSLCVLQLTGD